MKKTETIEKVSSTKTVGDKEIKVTTIKRKTPIKKKTSVKKKTRPKAKTSTKKIVRRRSPSMTKKDFESFQEKIVENFVSMQKVMTNLAEKFDGLTRQLSKLLELFDESAKALTEKEINLDIKSGKKEREIISKLNSVIDQNKLIAKGLTLIHENSVNSINYLQKTNQFNAASNSSLQIAPGPSSFRTNNSKENSLNNNPLPEKLPSQKPQMAKSKVIEQEGPFNSGEF